MTLATERKTYSSKTYSGTTKPYKDKPSRTDRTAKPHTEKLATNRNGIPMMGERVKNMRDKDGFIFKPAKNKRKM